MENTPKEVVETRDMDESKWIQTKEAVRVYMNNLNTKIINEWCADAKVASPVGYYNDLEGHIKIYTDRPGALIGKAGELVKKYQEQFNKEFNTNYSIEFVEIKGGFANINKVNMK